MADILKFSPRVPPSDDGLVIDEWPKNPGQTETIRVSLAGSTVNLATCFGEGWLECDVSHVPRLLAALAKAQELGPKNLQ
jgi:hypothetical protein